MKKMKKFLSGLLLVGALLNVGVIAKASSIDGPTIPPMTRIETMQKDQQK